mmetsp:Transcript_9930/g.19153  ORF Transcript_9930/g.19153 Transcript_9930/m.19153 type:complete len:206 (+) Transcript_9930:1142-1759(+)
MTQLPKGPCLELFHHLGWQILATVIFFFFFFVGIFVVLVRVSAGKSIGIIIVPEIVFVVVWVHHISRWGLSHVFDHVGTAHQEHPRRNGQARSIGHITIIFFTKMCSKHEKCQCHETRGINVHPHEPPFKRDLGKGTTTRKAQDHTPNHLQDGTRVRRICRSLHPCIFQDGLLILGVVQTLLIIGRFSVGNLSGQHAVARSTGHY